MSHKPNLPPTLQSLLHEGAARLAEKGTESPRLAVDFLLAHAMGWNPERLRRETLLTPDAAVPAELAERFWDFVQRYAQGEPVAYIIGEWEFYGLAFYTGPGTLIPRPESELLVDAALTAAKGMQAPVRIADLGTGTGCLAIAVLEHMEQEATALGVDRSPEALAVARRNVERHGLAARMTLLEADFTGPFAEDRSFDLILANPPYVSTAEYEALEPNVRLYEPRGALVPGTDDGYDRNGLEDIRALAARCALLLRPGGILVMEMGAGQGADAARLFHEQGGWENISVQADLAGRDRMLLATAKEHEE